VCRAGLGDQQQTREEGSAHVAQTLPSSVELG
jgi:hypothetical protein